MPDSLVIQQQREILSSLRQAITTRLVAEGEAQSRSRDEGESSKSVLNQEIEQTDVRIAGLTRSQERALEVLAAGGLQELWASRQAVASHRHTATQSSQALSRAVKAADQSLTALLSVWSALEAKRRSRSNQRALKVTMVVIGVLVVTTAGLLGFRTLRFESLYRSAAEALDLGQFATARDHVDAMAPLLRNHERIAELVLRSYFGASSSERPDCLDVSSVSQNGVGITALPLATCVEVEGLLVSAVQAEKDGCSGQGVRLSFFNSGSGGVWVSLTDPGPEMVSKGRAPETDCYWGYVSWDGGFFEPNETKTIGYRIPSEIDEFRITIRVDHTSIPLGWRLP